jgi:hypothetical protein
MKRHLLWRQDHDAQQKESAAAAVRRIVLRWSKKEMHQALLQWGRVCRRAAQLEQDNMRTNLAEGQDKVARLLSQAKAAERAQQSREEAVRAEYEAQLESLRSSMSALEETATSDVARKQLELTRLEEECTKVYATQQARDAATHAAYEEQLEELRRKLGVVEERARAEVAKKQLEVAHLASKCAAVDRSQQSRDAAYETQLAEARDKVRAVEEKARAVVAKHKLEVTRLESKCSAYHQQQVRDAAANGTIRKQLTELRAKMFSIGENATSDVARHKLEISRLESKCSVYRSKQIRDAAVNAEFEKQLSGLRAKMERTYTQVHSPLEKHREVQTHLSEVSRLEEFLRVDAMVQNAHLDEAQTVALVQQVQEHRAKSPRVRAGKDVVNIVVGAPQFSPNHGQHSSIVTPRRPGVRGSPGGDASPLRNLYDLLLDS